MADIFISYARPDRDWAEKLASALQAEGWSVWWDRQIEAGSAYSADIERELGNAKATIVCWSEAANQSDWVKDEAAAAHEQSKLVPVLLDTERPPIGFRQYQAVSFDRRNAPADAPAFRQLTQALKARITGAQVDTTAYSTRAGTEKKRSFANVPRWSIALFIVMAMAIAVMWLRRDATQPDDIATLEKSTLRSVAVLPFVSMSSTEEDEFFADGLSEELLSALAGIEDLKVPGRSATFAFKGKTGNLQEIGQSLGVEHVLEGSIRRSGERLRITAQLTSIADGYQLWSETYDRELDDLFAIQGDIARRVANALNSRLVEGDAILFDAGTQSAAAFQSYVEGRQYLARRGKWLSRAIASFESSIDIDPEYARAYAGLATAHVVSHIYLSVPKEIARKRAQTFANKAMELDPSLSEPLAVLGAIQSDQTNWSEATRLYREGEARNPDDVVVLQWHAELLANLGYLQDARAKIERALELEPGSAILNLIAGNVALCQDDFDHAKTYYTRAEDLGISDGVNGVSLVEFKRGDIDKSAKMRARTALAAQLIAEEDVEPLTAFYASIMRREAEVDASIASFPTLATDDDFLMPAYLFAGEREKALKTLENDPDGDLDSFFMLWANLDVSLRKHPYFATLATNTGLLDYWLTHGWPDACRAVGGGAPEAFECD